MKECIFCRIAAGKSNCWKIMETPHTLAFLDINPVSRYHTLVIPKNHYSNIFDINDAELREVISTVGEVAKKLQIKLGINNVQILSNNGREAQQDVFHLHFHLIPRSSGDGQNLKFISKSPSGDEFAEMIRIFESADDHS